MTVIEAAPSTFYDAATICNNAATSFFDGYVAQMRVLNGTEGMAGTVGAGKEWAASYDQQVRETNALVTAVVMAIDNYCAVLQQLGHNYALSDHDPNSAAAAPQKPGALPLAYDVCPVPPPSAGGTGAGIIDDGLELVSKVGIDLPAPDGNTDELDTAARAWSTLAAASTALLSELERAAVLFQNVTAPESAFVDEDIRELKSGAADLLATFADLSTACAEQKVAMADLRAQLKDTLRNLAEEISKEIAITLLLTATATVIGFGIGGVAVSAVRAGKFADKMKDTVDAIRRTVAASKLKRVVTLQRSTGNTRSKLQRIIDLVKKRGDDVKKVPKKRGTIDESAKVFNPKERKIADLLADEGKDVTSVLEGKQRTPDALVDGVPTEFKSLEGTSNGTVKNALNSAKGQADNALLDARESGMSQEEAQRGLNRFLGANPDSMKQIRIVGDGWEIVWP